MGTDDKIANKTEELTDRGQGGVGDDRSRHSRPRVRLTGRRATEVAGEKIKDAFKG